MDLTVVAFLNTDGGVLLVGGGDDADILGIEVDQFEEDFYVRVGPGSRRLSTCEVLAYMTNRKLEL